MLRLHCGYCLGCGSNPGQECRCAHCVSECASSRFYDCGVCGYRLDLDAIIGPFLKKGEDGLIQDDIRLITAKDFD